MNAIPPAKHALSERGKIGRADRSQPLLLSLEQESMWIMAQAGGADNARYHISLAFSLDGPLDESALYQAFRTIWNRHESLRTSFSIRNGQLVQQIADADAGPLLLEQDLSGLSGAVQQTRISQIKKTEASIPFNLAEGPLIRCQLLKLEALRHVLIVTLHHIISDGWSGGLLVDELSVLYDAFRRGLPDPLPPLDVQYVDYAMWQRQLLRPETSKAQLDYWLAQLNGAQQSLIPTDFPRDAAAGTASSSVELRLTSELTKSIKAFSSRNAVTPFMTLLAGWSLLLTRLSGRNDIVIGVPVANRTRVELRPIIGFFVNTLPMRVRVDLDVPVQELLSKIKTTTLRALTNREVPFARIVEVMNPDRRHRQNPIFQVMFTFDNGPGDRIPNLHGINAQALATEYTSSPMDLVLSLRENSGVIVGVIEYANNLFERASVERFASLLIGLLEDMTATDEQLVGDISLLPTKERKEVLLAFNDTNCVYPAENLVHEQFEYQAAMSPNAVAVIFEDRELTYGELNVRADRLASRLRHLGVKPETLVGIFFDRGFEMIVGIIGILKAGGAYVPLDPGYPAERLSYMLGDSSPAVLITHPTLLARLPTVSIPTVVYDMENEPAAVASTPAGDLNADVPAARSTNLAYVIYTSGSTGQPKGVMIEHRNLAASNFARLHYYGSADRHLLLSSISFDSSIAVIFGALTRLGTLVISKSQMDLDELRATIDRWHITSVLAVPSVLQMILAASTGRRFESLRRVIAAGESCPKSLIQDVSITAPNATLFNEYGPTEATVWATVHACRESLRGETMPIGRPVANVRVYILDPQRKPVPIGVSGEIFIGGAGVARGYLNNSALTDERFVEEPFGVGVSARMYKTGDVGKWLSNGTIEYLGRNDQQIKIRGYRIELGEIESHLRRCPGVRDAVVLARDATMGERRLIGYVTGREEDNLSTLNLRAQLLRVLPEYMVPGTYVLLESFPLTFNGKIDRGALPAPDNSLVTSQRYEAPVGELETAIAQIWQTLLHIEQIGRYDNFFELGGHSLLIVRFISSLKELGFGADVHSVFEAPTPHALATLLSAKGDAKIQSAPNRYKHIVKLNQGGVRRPLFCFSLVEGDTSAYVHLARFLDPSIPVYGLDAGYSEENTLSDDALDRLTESYENEIRRIQPRGPYRLCGFSFGGASAFETANNLEMDGEEVTLVLVDAYPFSMQVRILHWVMRIVKTVRDREVLATIKMKWQKLFIYENHRWLTGKDKDLTHALMRRATRRTYKPFSGSVILFKSSATPDDPYRFELDGRNGWGKYVRGSFKVVRLEAGHPEMMKEPAVHALVNHMNEILG